MNLSNRLQVLSDTSRMETEQDTIIQESVSEPKPSAVYLV